MFIVRQNITPLDLTNTTVSDRHQQLFVSEFGLKVESFVFGCESTVRNSEVSPKTTEASGDQRATGINYGLL